MEIRTDTSQWAWYVTSSVQRFFLLKIIGGRRIAVPFKGFMGTEWASKPIPRLCDGNVAPLKWTLRRRFIDVTPMESSKVAYYTPMPRLWFLTGSGSSKFTANTNIQIYVTGSIFIVIWFFFEMLVTMSSFRINNNWNYQIANLKYNDPHKLRTHPYTRHRLPTHTYTLHRQSTHTYTRHMLRTHT